VSSRPKSVRSFRLWLEQVTKNMRWLEFNCTEEPFIRLVDQRCYGGCIVRQVRHRQSEVELLGASHLGASISASGNLGIRQLSI